MQRLLRDHGAGRQGEIEREVLEEAFEVPVLRMPALAVGLDALVDQLPNVGLDVAPGVGAGEDLVPLVVDDRPLGVHHVVVLDQVLAGVEVHAFDLLLRALDRARHPLVFDRLDLELVHQPADAVGRGAEHPHQVVLERDEEPARARVALASGPASELVVDAAGLVPLGADDVEAAGAGHARTEHDVGAAAGHVGGDRDLAGPARLGDDRGLPLVLLGVEHVVGDASLLEQAREALRLLYRNRADEHRAALLHRLRDLVDNCVELRLLGLVDHVRVVGPHHRPVGRDHDHLEAVDLVELLGLGDGGAGHAGQLVVEPEVVLEGDRRQRLLLLLDLQAFLGLDRLVEAVRPAPARHRAAGELVDDHHLAIDDQVVAVAQVESLGLERLVDLVGLDHVLEVVDVGDASPALDLGDPFLSQGSGLVLLLHRVVVFDLEPR